MDDPIRTQSIVLAAGLPAFAPAQKPATGALFAQEVERATERARGDAGAERRLEGLASEKRASRRASFGRTREDESEVHASEALFRAADAPVKARLAAANAALAETDAAPSATPSAPGTPAGGVSGTNEAQAPASSSVISTTLANGVAASPAVTSAVAPGSAPDTLASGAARPGEPPSTSTFAPPRAQPTPGRTERASTAPPASAGPDPAVLERASEILRQIKLHLTPGVRRVTLDLEPAELGRMAIQLALRGGKVHGIVRAEHAETLELLRAREPELLALLAERGVSADAVRFELGFGGSRGRSHGAPSPDARVQAPPAAPRAPEILLTDPPRRGTALVDTYA